MEESAKLDAGPSSHHDLAAELRALEWEVLDMIHRLEAIRDQIRLLHEQVDHGQSHDSTP